MSIMGISADINLTAVTSCQEDFPSRTDISLMERPRRIEMRNFVRCLATFEQVINLETRVEIPIQNQTMPR